MTPPYRKHDCHCRPNRVSVRDYTGREVTTALIHDPGQFAHPYPTRPAVVAGRVRNVTQTGAPLPGGHNLTGTCSCSHFSLRTTAPTGDYVSTTVVHTS